MVDYAVALDAVIARFGLASQAHIAVEYTRLIELLERGYTTARTHQRKAEAQLQIVQGLINRAVRVRDVHHVRYDPDTEWLHFEETQDVRLPPRVNPVVRRLTEEIIVTLPSATHFMYVLSTESLLMIETTPLTTVDIFFPDAQSARERIRHPQILGPHVPVLGAGEVSVFHTANRAYAALINNRSGHFRPPPQSLIRVRNALCRELSLSADCVMEVTVNAYRRQ